MRENRLNADINTPDNDTNICNGRNAHSYAVEHLCCETALS